MTGALKVLASNCLRNAGGDYIASGFFSVVTTDQYGSPIPAESGGQQFAASPATRPIVNGSITGADLFVPDPSVSSPLHVRILITIVDTSNQIYSTTKYPNCPASSDGSGNWNFATMLTGLTQPQIPVTVGLNFRGPWQPDTVYSLLDIFTYGGSVYTPITGFTSGSTFDDSNLQVFAAAGTITPSLLAMLQNAFDYSSENSALQQVGTSGFADTAVVLSATTFALPQRLPTGLLTSISLTVGQYITGSSVITIYILNDLGGNSFSVASSFTLNPVGTGLQTFYAGGAFDPIEVEEGQLIAFYSVGARVGFSAAGAGGYLQLTGPASTTPATYLSESVDTLDFSVSVRVPIPPTELSPALTLKLNSAYAWSQANSLTATVGPADFPFTLVVQPSTAYVIPDVLAAGQLNALRIGFGPVPASATLTVFIMNRDSIAGFSVVDSFTLNVAPQSAAGYQNFSAGVDFDSRQVLAGQYIGFQSLNGARVGFNASPNGFFELHPFGTVPSATAIGISAPEATVADGVTSWYQTGSFTFAFTASLLVFSKPLTPLDSSYLVSGGRTLLEHSSFLGPSFPVGYGQSGGWSIASGGGLLSPSTGQGFGCQAYSSNILNVERRTYRVTFEMVSAGSSFAVFGSQLDGKDAQFGSQIAVDANANTLVLSHALFGSFTYGVPTINDPGVSQAVPLGFSVVVGTKYTLIIQLDKRVMTISIADPVTGITANIVSGSYDAENIDEADGGPAGLMMDSIGFKCLAGQIKVDEYFIYANAKYPRAVFFGDSITHGAGVKVYERWAELVAGQTGNCLIGGHASCSSDNTLAQCESQLPFLIPEYIVVMIGSNDAVPGNIGLAGWQANYTSIIAKADALGIKVIACTLPPRGDVAQSIINSFNAWLLTLSGVTIVRMDRALTVNSDGVTQDTTLYQADRIHPNPAGSIRMAARFAIDAPSLLDAPAIIAQSLLPPVFGASGVGHSAGIVPDPGATPGNTRFACEDGTWRVPAVAGSASGVLVDSVTGQHYTVGVANGALVAVVVATIPTAIVFADTDDGAHYSLSIVSGAETLTPVSSSVTLSAPLVLIDTVTGDHCNVSVTDGALTWPVVSSSVAGVASFTIADSATASNFILAITNGALTWTPA